MNDLNQNEIYKKYLDSGINNFSTKELLDLSDILYGLGLYHELIDVAEYTVSLIDMGISNDFIEEDLNDWINEGYDDETDDFEEEIPEENIDNEDITGNDDEELEEEERKSDNIDALREYLLKIIIECALKEGNYDKVYATIDKFLETTDIREADLYNDVALIGMGIGDHLFAIKYLRMIQNDQIHKVAAVNNLAICYEALGEAEKGIM